MCWTGPRLRCCTVRLPVGLCSPGVGLCSRVPTAPVPAGTILLDSVNLSPAAGKVTPRDVRCVSLLESRFPELPPHDSIYGALQAAKFNVSGLVLGARRRRAGRCAVSVVLALSPSLFPGLTTEQMLRKDLKTVSSDEQVLATSGIYMDIEVRLSERLRPGAVMCDTDLCPPPPALPAPPRFAAGPGSVLPGSWLLRAGGHDGFL